MNRRRTMTLLRLLLFALGAYAVVVLIYAVLQERLIFFPSKSSETSDLQRANEAGWRPWRNPADELIGWRLGDPEARQRMLVFHGNAGSALDRRYLARGFAFQGDERVWEVIVMEYPGYGSRPGKLGQQSFVEAGRAAVDQLNQEDDRPIVLAGESIGSGVASAVAAGQPESLAGVLLITPFRSLKEVAQKVVPWMPVGLMLRHRFDNSSALKDYGGPVAFLLARRDEVVGFETGQALHDEYQAGRKWLEIQEHAGHNDVGYLPAMPWFQEVTAFFGAK